MVLAHLVNHRLERPLPVGESAHMGFSGAFACRDCGYGMAVHTPAIYFLLAFTTLCLLGLGGYLLVAGIEMLGTPDSPGNDPTAMMVVKVLFLGGGGLCVLVGLKSMWSLVLSVLNSRRCPPIE